LNLVSFSLSMFFFSLDFIFRLNFFVISIGHQLANDGTIHSLCCISADWVKVNVVSDTSFKQRCFLLIVLSSMCHIKSLMLWTIKLIETIKTLGIDNLLNCWTLYIRKWIFYFYVFISTSALQANTFTCSLKSSVTIVVGIPGYFVKVKF
jgi:hypothetical protein